MAAVAANIEVVEEPVVLLRQALEALAAPEVLVVIEPQLTLVEAVALVVTLVMEALVVQQLVLGQLQLGPVAEVAAEAAALITLQEAAAVSAY